MSEMWDTVINGGMIKEDICFPNYIFKVIFTIVFPPLGVAIDEHGKGYPNVSRIIITLILTLMFYFPGLIYAFSTNSYN